MNWLKERLRATLDWLGLEVHGKAVLRLAYERELRERELRAWQVLGRVPFRQILDVGANEGQFAAYPCLLWPEARIDCFEPDPDVYEKLRAAHRQHPNVRAHPIAHGRERHVAEIRRNSFSPSSSLLPLTSLHTDEWPDAREASRIAIHVERLDDWAVEHGGVQQPLLVKIDVQGFEDQVIDGGLSTILKAQWFAVEVSFHELYVQQPLFDAIYAQLIGHGFRYRGNVQQFLSREENRCLFADALFENARLIAS